MINTFALIPCPACEEPIRADVYPALFRELPSGHAGDPLRAESEIKSLETHRVCYDKVTFFVALISTILIWPTIITAPIVLFMVIRYWSAPGSIIPRSKIRFILAFGIACLQIAAWILFLGELISA
ncbi:MAG: hypothetical protein P8185_21580 [Deltaproteobacteria bacterium]